MAIQNVSATIALEGEDNASAEINKARGAVKRLADEAAQTGEEAEKLGEKLTEAGEKTGHLSHGISTLLRATKSFAGESAGALGEMTHGLHGVSAIIHLLPGPIGLVGAGIVAAGLATLAWKNSAHEAAVEETKHAAEELAHLKGNASALAAYLEIKTDLLEKEKAEVDYRAENLKLAGELVEAEGKARIAKAEGKVEEELHQVNLEIAAKNSLKWNIIALKNQTERAAEEKKVADATKLTLQIAELESKNYEKQTELIGDKGERLKRQIAQVEAAQAKVDADRREAQEKFTLGLLTELQLKHRLLQLDGEALDLDHKQLAVAKESAHHHGGISQAKKNAAEWSKKARDNEASDLKELEIIRESAAKRELALQAEMATDPAEKARLRNIERETELVKQQTEVRNATFATDKARGAALVALDRRDAAERAKIERDLAADIKKAKDDAAAHEKSANKEKLKGEIDIADAVKGAMEKVGISKRAISAVDAAIEAAKAIAAYADADIPGAIAHTTASVEFAAVAGGIGGGGGSGGSAPSSPTATRAGSGNASSSGGPHNTTIILQGGAYVGTIQGVGKAFQAAQQSIKNTGLTPGMGAV
jgi:hypothetical protein